MRVHGCQPPLNGLQISAWMLKVTFVVIFFILYAPMLPYSWNIAAFVVVGILFIFTLSSGLWVTFSNPVDDNVVISKEPRAAEVTIPKGKHVIDEKNYCCLCKVHVNKKSKHCRLCDKCVDTFDHHCKWLNNCIGAKNYTIFLVYISSVFASTFCYLVVGIYLFIECFVERTSVVNRLNELYGVFNPYVYIVLVLIFTLLDIVVFGLITHLLTFHIRIAFFQHITTYDFIIAKRTALELQEKEKADSFNKAPKPGRAIRCNAKQKHSNENSTTNTNLSMKETPSFTPPSTATSSENTHKESTTQPHPIPPNSLNHKPTSRKGSTAKYNAPLHYSEPPTSPPLTPSQVHPQHNTILIASEPSHENNLFITPHMDMTLYSNPDKLPQTYADSYITDTKPEPKSHKPSTPVLPRLEVPTAEVVPLNFIPSPDGKRSSTTTLPPILSRKTEVDTPHNQ